jgi:hypothetical protein
MLRDYGSSSSSSSSSSPVIPYGRQQNVAIWSYLWPSSSPLSSSFLFLIQNTCIIIIIIIIIIISCYPLWVSTKRHHLVLSLAILFTSFQLFPFSNTEYLHHHHHHHHLLLSLMGVNKTSPSGPVSGHPLHLVPALSFF